VKRREAMALITRNLQGECLQDLAEDLGCSYNTLLNWRDNPPENPSLRIFVLLANHYRINMGIWELEEFY